MWIRVCFLCIMWSWRFAQQSLRQMLNHTQRRKETCLRLVSDSFRANFWLSNPGLLRNESFLYSGAQPRSTRSSCVEFSLPWLLPSKKRSLQDDGMLTVTMSRWWSTSRSGQDPADCWCGTRVATMVTPMRRNTANHVMSYQSEGECWGALKFKVLI